MRMTAIIIVTLTLLVGCTNAPKATEPDITEDYARSTPPSVVDDAVGGQADSVADSSTVQIGETGVFAEVSERLPATFGAATSTTLEFERSEPTWTLRAGSDERVRVGLGGRKSTINSIWTASDYRLVRFDVDTNRAESLYGQVKGLAVQLNPLLLIDESGNQYNSIGYVLLRSDATLSIDIRDQVAENGVSAAELPTLGDGERLYLYFQVPVEKIFVAYRLGPTVTKFNHPLLISKMQ